MKLSDLMKAITPLPYRVALNTEITASPVGIVEGSKRVSDCHSVIAPHAEANAAYLTHCANVLPELVEALRMADLNYARTNDSQPDLMGDDEFEAWRYVKAALALAAEVQVPS